MCQLVARLCALVFISKLCCTLLECRYGQLVDTWIKKVLEQRGEADPRGGLTPQDLFYRQVKHKNSWCVGGTSNC